MKPELIVMLTHMDKTVQNAYELFEQSLITSLNIPVGMFGVKRI